MTPSTQSGNVLEKTVVSVFQSKKFVVAAYRAWQKNPAKFGEEVLLTNAPYETIYKHRGHTEYLLRSKRFNKEIRIECKWQQVSGSVDEKLPYLYLNCIETMPEKEIIIVIDGDGWKKGAIEWFKEAVTNRRYTDKASLGRVVRIFNLKEFITWANKEF